MLLSSWRLVKKHLFGFEKDENRQKGSKENSYPTLQLKVIHLTIKI
jgi:hypothetical protein